MKRSHALLAVVVVGFLTLAFAISRGAGLADGTVLAEPKTKEPGLISVTGDADVRVIPDQVLLTLGIETQDADLTKAKARNDEVAAGLLALAEEYDIAARNVQTDYISVFPVYEDEYSVRSRLVAYRVQRMVVITLSDISRFEGLLSDALLAGANHVHGVQFRTTELRKHRDQARALALRAAREKAEALTAELGLRVGEPRTITEEYSGWWSWYDSWWGSRYGGSMAQNVVQEVGSAGYAPDSALAPGQITVNARISVTFEIAH